ncbi:hypothetical protein F5Y18DRAFT_398060 [Xylariaceae sp. FL1019]|nr:hypothetical protein F5Y18DRAFT_398060 [Xylariaceae sp. FL1019]
MDSQTFHPFPDLPAELRLMIWEAALHPHEPSAQFFSLADNNNEYCEDDYFYMDHQAKKGSDLAAPCSRQIGELSWTNNNLSAYMIDHGLWTACKESRAVMLKYHERREKAHYQRPWICSDKFRDSRSIHPTTVKGRVLCDNHERRYISFDPNIDLVAFHLPCTRYDSCPSLVTTLRRLGKRQFEAKNIAVEYIPGGKFGSQGQLFRPEHVALLEAITYKAQLQPFCPTLWFIDYQVVLKPGHTCPNERTTFKGLSCRFVEMKETDACWDVVKKCRVFVNGIQRARARSSYREVFEMTSQITCEVVRQSSRWNYLISTSFRRCQMLEMPAGFPIVGSTIPGQYRTP